MVREELISSADPSVASAAIDKRISFLQSKNLTKEEIDVALARAGEDSSVAAAPTGSGYQSAPQQAVYRPPSPPSQQGYGYPPYGQWQPPPEPPKRDWRDWFIMATVMGGVSYGLYFVAKRYITPLIAPPTPPQIEQDKQNIDEQFSRAFALIEQLSTDTAALKNAEEARTDKLDGTLRDVETLLGDLKTASRRRDDETRRINDEVNALKDAIPKALEGAREGNENRLRELGTELKSLKVLLGNRIGGVVSNAPVTAKVPETTLPSTSEPTSSNTPATNGATPTSSHPETPSTSSGAAQTAPSTSTNPLSRFSKSPSIPAWQLAAANRSKTASPSTPASTEPQQYKMPQPTSPTHRRRAPSNSPSRARSRSRSPARSPRHSRHHRHRDDSDRHHRHKHSHSHRRDHHGDRSSKNAATTTATEPIVLPFNTRELTKRDLELFEPMFAMYLDIQKNLILEDIGEEEVKGRWKSFIRKWNRGELARGWYDPATLEKAKQNHVSGRRESPDYGRRPEVQGQAEVERQRDVVPSAIAAEDEDEDDEYGPMPSHGWSNKGCYAAGPTIPNMQDLELRKETAAEDALAERTSARKFYRAEIRSHKSNVRYMEDEVAPRAEPGTHERRMEKRREASDSNRAFASARRGGSPTDAAPEDELMGSAENDLDVIKSSRDREQRKKNEREIRREEILRARTAEREERVRQYKEKEDETIGWLKTLAKERFG
ncbi:peroxisomal membrane anchor protein conserved region-domain-containing protein [Aspergillus californicus]